MAHGHHSEFLVTEIVTDKISESNLVVRVLQETNIVVYLWAVKQRSAGFHKL